MRESQPVLILDRTFPSKAAALRLCKKIIDATPVGQRIHGFHESFLLAVIARHPHYDLKTAKGVRSLTVSDGGLSYGSYRHGKCLCIVADDGSKIEISVKKCFQKETRDPNEPLRPKPVWIKGGSEVICEYRSRYGRIEETSIKTNASEVILLVYKGRIVRKIIILADDGSDVRSFVGHYQIRVGEWDAASPTIAQLRALKENL